MEVDKRRGWRFFLRESLWRLSKHKLRGENSLQRSRPPENNVYVLTPPFTAKQKSLMHIRSHTWLLRQSTWMLEKLHHNFGTVGRTHSLFLLPLSPLINFSNVRPPNSQNQGCRVEDTASALSRQAALPLFPPKSLISSGRAPVHSYLTSYTS